MFGGRGGMLDNEEQKYGETVSLKNEKPYLTVLRMENSGCPFVEDCPQCQSLSTSEHDQTNRLLLYYRIAQAPQTRKRQRKDDLKEDQNGGQTEANKDGVPEGCGHLTQGRKG